MLRCPWKRWKKMFYMFAFFLSVCFNACFLWVKVTERSVQYTPTRQLNASSSAFLRDIMNTELKHTQEYPESRPKQILIVSYMRSGSSLTGDILQQHRNMFYVFEPLFSIERLIKTRMPAVYLNSHNHQFYGLSRENVTMVRTVSDVFRCNFTALDVMTLHQHHLMLSQSTEQYYKCVQNKTLLQIDKLCIRDMMIKCLDSKYVLVKSIRLTMKMTGELLDQFPDLKVIHLIRDPRGTIMSRVRLGPGGITSSVLASEIKRVPKYCSQIKEDLVEAHRLRYHFPGRVAILLYEKLVESPVSMAEELYKFLGLRIAGSIKKYVYNITNGLEDTCPVCTKRKNASVTAYKWRTLINFPSAFTIDSACAGVYSELGYTSITSESQLVNNSFKTWREKYVPGMITNNPNAKLLFESV